jgi:lipid-binding SYLF domain-containing protein
MRGCVKLATGIRLEPPRGSAMKKLLCTLLVGLGATTAMQAHAQAREEARLIEASSVLEELRGIRDQGIPDRLLSRAYGIAVIPNVVKVSAVVGGRRGSGAMVVRDENGKFSNPIMIAITGGSIGWQIGVQSTDVVLVFTTPEGIEGITDGKLTLGGDASVAAGPVGRSASAATDPTFSAEVYSYSRNRGLFAGVSLDGSAITIDKKSNNRLYKRRASAADIIAGKVTTDVEAARRFLRVVQTSTAHSPTAPSSAGTATSTPDAGAPAVVNGQPSSATTFPLEDKEAGKEPPR